jgi:hypothetical protein
MQDPAGRLNAQWAVIPTQTVGRAADNHSYRLCQLRDRKHRKFLAASTSDGVSGPLQHLESGSNWMRINAATY